MIGKIKKLLQRVLYELSKDSCYYQMETRGYAQNGCCGGVMGGDRDTEYLKYSCIDCPYFSFSFWKAFRRRQMSERCNKCGEVSHSWSSYKGDKMCTTCVFKLKKAEVVGRAEQTKTAEDFKGWTAKDMTTAFFEVFGRYLKNPSKEDWLIIMRIYYWACHAEHGVSTTISYTMDWAKINRRTEYKRWGL